MAKKKVVVTTYDPKRIALVLIVAFVLVVGLSVLYDTNHYTEEWVVCNNDQHKYDNYEEVIKYRFLKGTLYGFYRVEVIVAENQEVFDNLYKTLDDTRNNLNQNDDLSYVIKTDNLTLNVSTYIGVANIPNFFDAYIVSTNLNRDSKKEDILKYYQEEGYTCKVSHK